LKRTKSAKKTNATFDYESELFVPIDDGEFVLIRDIDEQGKSIVIPRSSQLESRRDFYELYQDYYHCSNPDAGEIHVEQPAVVIPTTEGWKLMAPGVLAIAGKEPARRTTIPPAPPQRNVQMPPVPPPKNVQPESPKPRKETRKPVAPKPDSPAALCAQCDTLIESKYAFCWKCGHPRDAEENTSASERKMIEDKPESRPRGNSQRSRLIVPASESDDEERTVQHDGHVPLYSWGSEPSGRQSRIDGSVLKLFGLAIGAFIIFSLTLIGIWHFGSRSESVNAAETTPPPSANSEVAAQPIQNAPAVQQTPAPVAAATPVASTTAEDNALARLRQIRKVAKAGDNKKVLETLSDSEKKYADDYRFPYERARVVVIDHVKNFPIAAFAALSRAAQKAINKGKAGEMLQSLIKDSDGDFQALARRRHEWDQLQKALKKNDASGLSLNEGL